MLPIRQMIASPSLPNVPGWRLNPGPLWVTVHETGNPTPTAGAEFHARYVNSGGGPSMVSFHFAVDKFGAYQMLPLDTVGWHASDGCDNREQDTGCYASIAIETCVNDPVASEGWRTTQDNLVELIARIIVGDDRIAYGSGRGRFDITRIRPHKRWAVDRKHCPQRMLDSEMITVSGTGTLIRLVAEEIQELRGNGTPPTTKPPAPPIRPTPMRPGDQRINGHLFVGVPKTVTITREVQSRQWADPASAAIGKPEPVGRIVSTSHVCIGADGNLWYILVDGRRIPVDATIGERT